MYTRPLKGALNKFFLCIYLFVSISFDNYKINQYQISADSAFITNANSVSCFLSFNVKMHEKPHSKLKFDLKVYFIPQVVFREW